MIQSITCGCMHLEKSTVSFSSACGDGVLSFLVFISRFVFEWLIELRTLSKILNCCCISLCQRLPYYKRNRGCGCDPPDRSVGVATPFIAQLNRHTRRTGSSAGAPWRRYLLGGTYTYVSTWACLRQRPVGPISFPLALRTTTHADMHAWHVFRMQMCMLAPWSCGLGSTSMSRTRRPTQHIFR